MNGGFFVFSGIEGQTVKREMSHMKKLSIMGVQCDYGQQRRGVDMGPSAIRYAGLIERLLKMNYFVKDYGDIQLYKAIYGHSNDNHLLNLDEITQMGKELSTELLKALNKGEQPLILGGDHSIAIGTLAALTTHYHHVGVIWFDAHADMNTPETTPSGNIHGMSLAISLGLGTDSLLNLFTRFVAKEHVVLIGARSLDEGERQLIKKLGIKVYTMHEIDRLGMAQVMNEVIHHFKNLNLDAVHLSVDLDALDPLYTPGVGTPVAGGITYRESHLAMEMLYESELIKSAEFVEVNPILDEKNQTANVAVALIGSLLGETLL